MNKVILMGNMVNDPELRKAGELSVCSFRIGVQRKFANKEGVRESDFFTIVAWRQTADFVARYFKKGQKILVIGSLQTRSYDDNDGVKRYVTEVVADEVEFCEKKSDSAPSQPAPNYDKKQIAGTKNEFTPDDEDLPF